MFELPQFSVNRSNEKNGYRGKCLFTPVSAIALLLSAFTISFVAVLIAGQFTYSGDPLLTFLAESILLVFFVIVFSYKMYGMNLSQHGFGLPRARELRLCLTLIPLLVGIDILFNALSVYSGAWIDFFSLVLRVPYMII